MTRTRENLAERIEEAVAFSKEIDRNTRDELEGTLLGELGTTTTGGRFCKSFAKRPTANRSRMSAS